MRREKSNIAPKYAVYRAYASDTSGTNFSTTQSDTLPFMAEHLSEFVIEPSKINAALFTGKWVRYIPALLGLLPETVLVSVDSGGANPDLPITVTTSLMIGVSDDIANWTITTSDATNCTATIVSQNVRIDTLTADSGSIVVRANKTGYTEITKTLAVKRVYDGASGSAVGYDDVTIGMNGSSELYVKNDGIQAEQILDGEVTADKIASGAVVESKIGTGAVTVNKIGTGAVTDTKLGTGSVTEVKIGANAVAAAKLKSDVVDGITMKLTSPGNQIATKLLYKGDGAGSVVIGRDGREDCAAADYSFARGLLQSGDSVPIVFSEDGYDMISGSETYAGSNLFPKKIEFIKKARTTDAVTYDIDLIHDYTLYYTINYVVDVICIATVAGSSSKMWNKRLIIRTADPPSVVSASQIDVHAAIETSSLAWTFAIDDNDGTLANKITFELTGAAGTTIDWGLFITVYTLDILNAIP